MKRLTGSDLLLNAQRLRYASTPPPPLPLPLPGRSRLRNACINVAGPWPASTMPLLSEQQLHPEKLELQSVPIAHAHGDATPLPSPQPSVHWHMVAGWYAWHDEYSQQAQPEKGSAQSVPCEHAQCDDVVPQPVEHSQTVSWRLVTSAPHDCSGGPGPGPGPGGEGGAACALAMTPPFEPIPQRSTPARK